MAGSLFFWSESDIYPCRFILPVLSSGRPVWKILLQIPYGHTMTYGEIARELAEKQKRSHMAAQAVGGAVGHNEISIIIPCHRVVGSNGSLTGYAGGIDKKIALLQLEHAEMNHLVCSKKMILNFFQKPLERTMERYYNIS